MVAGRYNPDAFNPGRAFEENMPADRSFGEWAGDVAIDTTRGIGKMAAAVPAILGDVLPAGPDGRPYGQSVMEQFRKSDEFLAGQRSKKAQFKERTGQEDAGVAQRALEAGITGLPMMAAGIGTGGAGAALAFGAQAYGNDRGESEARIYGRTEQELASNPEYTKLREQGMDDAQARHKLYGDSLDPVGAIATTVGGGLGGYGLGRAFTRMGMRTGDVAKMTDRITRRVPLAAAEAGAGMGIQGGTAEFARQRSEQASGFRQEMDPDKILQRTIEDAEIGGVMGGVMGIPRRGPVKPRDKPAAEPPDADTLATLAGQLNDPLQPSTPEGPAHMPGGVPLRGPRERIDDPYGGGPSGPHMPSEPSNRPPYMPPEPPPGVPPPPPPAGPAAPPPPTGAPPPPVARARPTGVQGTQAAQMPGGAPMRGARQPIVDPYGEGPGGAHMPSEPTGRPAYMPAEQVVPAATVEVAPRFTREELFARAADPAQTPDQGALQRHIAEWQRLNPSEKIGADFNKLSQTVKAARQEEAKAAKEAKTAEAVAKPVEPEAVVTPPSKLVEEVKPVVEPVKPVEELVVEPTKLVVKEEPKAAVSGAAAKEKIAEVAQKRAEAKAEALKVAKGPEDKQAAKDTEADRKGTSREDHYQRRHAAARDVRQEHAPGANFVEELKALRENLLRATGDARETLIKQVIDPASKMVKDYAAKISELHKQFGNREVFGGFDPAGVARGGKNAGPFHAYQAAAHNFVRGASKDLMKKQVEAARRKALAHLDRELEMLKSGGEVELEVKRRARNERVALQKKTKSTEEGTEATKRATEAEMSAKRALEDESHLTPEEKLLDKEAQEKNEPDTHAASYGGEPGRNFRGGKSMHVTPDIVAKYAKIIRDAHQKKGDKVHPDELSDLFEAAGGAVRHTTMDEFMSNSKNRPDNAILAAIYDRIHEVVKDLPATIWSANAMAAFSEYSRAGSKYLAFVNPSGGVRAYFKPDTHFGRTLFHEALHMATQRALYVSPQFNRMVTAIQAVIKLHHGKDPLVTGMPGYQNSMKNAHEFISEIYTREDLFKLLEQTNLSRADAAWLHRQGYEADLGKSLLRTLWDGFLKTIGYKPETPSAAKVVTDLLSDMMAYEHRLTARDRVLQYPTGRWLGSDWRQLTLNDPIMERALKRAREGNHTDIVNQLMREVERVRQGKPSSHYAVAEGYLRALNAEVYGREVLDPVVTPVSNPSEFRTSVADFLDAKAGTVGKEIAFRLREPPARLRSVFGYGLTWTRKLGEVGEQGFRDTMGKGIDLMAKHSAFAERYISQSGGQKLLSDLADLKSGIKDRELWHDFERFMIRESGHGAYVDELLHQGRNKHIGKDALVDEQTRQDHAGLQGEWQELVRRNPDFKEMRDRLHDYGRKEQALRSRELISDMSVELEMTGATDQVGRQAIVKRVLGEQAKWTAAEKARIDEIAKHPDYEENIKDIKKSRELAMMAGPWVPFMRRGGHQLLSKFKVEPDQGVDYKPTSKTPKDGVHEGFDFADVNDAKKFIKDKLGEHGLTQTGGHEVVLDKRTGEAARIYTDAEFAVAQEKAKAEAEAANVKFEPLVNRLITPKEFKAEQDKYPNAELRHRVTFNPRDYQMFESERLAHEERARRVPTDEAGVTLTTDVNPSPEHLSRANAPQTSSALQRLINRFEAKQSYRNLDTSQQGRLKRDLLVESMRIQTTSARRSRFLPRTNARGASTDLLANYMEFVNSQAHSMADLKFRAEITEALEGVDKYNTDFRYTKGHDERVMAAAELKQRAYAPPLPRNWANEGVSKALRVSQVSHLADLGYLVVNATDNWINALPVVGAKHGYWKAAAALKEASALFNPAQMAKAAFGDMKQAGQRRAQTVNYEELAASMIDTIADKGEVVRLKENNAAIFERGLISRDAGMEIERLRRLDANQVGALFERVDGTMRAATTGLETHNRLSLATMAYRLEYAATKDHAAAMKYAQDMVFKGAGDMAMWNSPRYANSPWLRLGMQFKKFPMRIMANYADAIMGTARGDPQMAKQLALMLATQSVAAGALGLPLGPASGAVNAGYMLGMWDSNWDDVTAAARGWVAKHTDPKAAEIIFHGLPRILGIDMSRLGHNSMVFFGSPDKPGSIENLQNGLWMLAGAPGDLVKKYIDGQSQAREAWSLHQSGAHEQAYSKAVEAATNLIQVKAVTDIGRAFVQSSGPATQTKGGVPLGNEYNTYQAIVRAIGITPAEEAEATEKRTAIKRAVAKKSEAHTRATQMFVKANDKELASIWQNIQTNYNPGKSPEEQISYSDLLKARARAEKQSREDLTGVGAVLSKKNRGMAEQYNYYNTGR